MGETLIAELLRYCKTTYGIYGIDLSRSSSARDLLTAEICMLKSLVALGRAAMQRWCAQLGDGYVPSARQSSTLPSTGSAWPIYRPARWRRIKPTS